MQSSIASLQKQFYKRKSNILHYGEEKCSGLVNKSLQTLDKSIDHIVYIVPLQKIRFFKVKSRTQITLLKN